MNYTRTENAHNAFQENFPFFVCIEVQQLLCFPFPLLRHYHMDASMLKTAVFELVQQFYQSREIGNERLR